MQRNTHRAERLQIMLAPEELEAIDNFRFENRMPSRAAAVREVMRRGLSATDVEPSLDGRRSAEFGVLAKERCNGDPAKRELREQLKDHRWSDA